MSFIQYSPLPSLRDVQEEINRIFTGKLNNKLDEKSIVTTSEWSPYANIVEKKDFYMVCVDVPGVDPKEIKVTMHDGILTIEGERKREDKEEKENFSRYECSYGSFCRRFRLPDGVDPEKINAKSENGVLEVTIPKSEKYRPKEFRIEVK